MCGQEVDEALSLAGKAFGMAPAHADAGEALPGAFDCPLFLAHVAVRFLGHQKLLGPL
jgi:hypothetical protein